MRPTRAEVLTQALKLSDDERRELAIELLNSAIAPGIQEAWIDEARRRVADVDSGKVATLTNEEAWRIVVADD